MPVTLEPIEDGYVLHYIISDPVNIYELMNVYKDERAYRDKAQHIVHSINDLSRVRRIPPNWLRLRSGPGLSHPRSGEIVLFGLSPSISIIVETILKTVRFKRMKIFSKEAEAWAYIKKLAAEAKAMNAPVNPSVVTV